MKLRRVIVTYLLLHELLLQRLEARVAVAAEQPQKLALDARCVGRARTDGSAVVASL